MTTNADSGPGSLRNAITAVNASAGPHEIHFAIPGGGVQTITLLTDLPSITETVTIDGYTQPGSTPNSNGPGLGLNTALRVELRGGPPPEPAFGLRFQAPDCVVRGVAINSFSTIIVIGAGANRSRVEGCFVGTDPFGIATPALFSTGIVVANSIDCVIGGETPDKRNLISGASNNSIELTEGGSGHRVQGNLIGTDAAGERSLQPDIGGLQAGIVVHSATNSVIGGMTAAAGNVISGQEKYGVVVGNCLDATATGTLVLSNFIGTDASGSRMIGIRGIPVSICANQTTLGLPGAGNVIVGGLQGGVGVSGSGCVIQGNKIGTAIDGISPRGANQPGLGVFASNVVVGGIGAGEGNVIAYHTSSGIYVLGATGVRIRGNSIHSNHSSGIILDHIGPAIPNDAGDLDAGANNRQNYPVLESVTSDGATTTVSGTLDSAPNAVYSLDFYSNDCPPQDGILQGQTFLGSGTVTTDGQGIGAFDVLLPIGLEADDVISATATDSAGNTSEFSQRGGLFGVDNLTTGHGYGNPSGGDFLTIFGDFSAPVTGVRIGGVSLANVTHVDATRVEARGPALPAGTAHTVEADDTNGRTIALARGWVSMFDDAPFGGGAGWGIWRLLASEVTAGCAPGLYCGDAPVTRAQMAVFLLRGARGICYSPPPATGTVFADVPAGAFAAAWIEALALSGITAGCGGGNFCPDAHVTREQMAVFLVRALTEGYVAPPCLVPHFADVPCSSIFAPWIEELLARRVTAGCGAVHFCPSELVTRSEMAVFLQTAFFLGP